MCSHVLKANAEGMCAGNLTCFTVNINKVPQGKYTYFHSIEEEMQRKLT